MSYHVSFLHSKTKMLQEEKEKWETDKHHSSSLFKSLYIVLRNENSPLTPGTSAFSSGLSISSAPKTVSCLTWLRFSWFFPAWNSLHTSELAYLQSCHIPMHREKQRFFNPGVRVKLLHDTNTAVYNPVQDASSPPPPHKIDQNTRAKAIWKRMIRCMWRQVLNILFFCVVLCSLLVCFASLIEPLLIHGSTSRSLEVHRGLITHRPHARSDPQPDVLSFDWHACGRGWPLITRRNVSHCHPSPCPQGLSSLHVSQTLFFGGKNCVVACSSVS